jgi:polysaccharide biosynthesis protein PslG
MSIAPARLRRLAVALALLASLAVAAPARAAELGLVTDLTWGAAAADQDREYGLLDDLHARWIRVEVNWAEAEPSKGAYDAWSLGQIDAAVRRNRAAGRNVVIMVGKAPQWASGSSDQGTPPRDPADYARFVGMLAKRYAGDGIAGYEIWNEENIGRFWGGAPDPAGYVALLRAASAAVRAADPDAKVVFGGLSTNDYEFVRRAYAAGAKGAFDVMALHPYSCEADVTQVKRDGSGRVAGGSFLGYRAIRELMVAQGDARPMWFTELGWATTSRACGVSPDEQAARIRATAALAAQDDYVEAVMYYNLRNNYWMGDADDTEAQYGVLTARFAAKPAYAAFKAAATRLVSPPAPGPAAPGPAPEAPEPVAPPAVQRPAAPSGHPAPSGGAKRPKIKLRTARRSRGRAGIVLAGRVVGARGAPKVRLSMTRHQRRIVRHVRAHRGRFTLSVRVLRRGRWRVAAALAGHPRARAATVVVVR